MTAIEGETLLVRAIFCRTKHHFRILSSLKVSNSLLPLPAGILLPIIARLNMAQSRIEALAGNRTFDDVVLETQQFPTFLAPISVATTTAARQLTDMFVIYGFIVIAPVAVKRIADEKSVGMKVPDILNIVH